MKIHFGKYKGQELDDVPANYLLWLYESETIRNGAIYDYIVKNLQGLKKQREEGNGEQ